MAYREVDMWEIREVLRQIGLGQTQAAVARATGKDRKTVRQYIRRARALGWDGRAETATEELAGRIQRSLWPVPEVTALGASEERLWPHRETIRTWLQPDAVSKRGLRLAKVHHLLARRGIEVPYSTLHRFAVRHCGFADRRRITVRVVSCDPGEVGEVDFGELGLVWDPEDERRRKLHGLIVTLPYSCHQYVHTTHQQKLQDVIAGLEDSFAFFGGVPHRLIVDNLRAAICRADRYEPEFQRVFAEYARHRGFVIDAAVVRHPTGKPHVERQVQYVRENFFRGEDWRHRDHVQEHAIRWCTKIAGMRVHGTTRQRPLIVFEESERHMLLPFSGPRFVVPQFGECIVHRDHHIQFLCSFYSVPTQYIGKKVTAMCDGKLVRIYLHGEPIKLHPMVPKGRRSTDPTDYPQDKAAYAMRDVDSLIQQAHKLGPHAGQFVRNLLGGDLPWAKLRQAQQILSLGRKYGAVRTDHACRTALAFEIDSSVRVKRILEQGVENAPLPPANSGQVIQLPLRFARDAQSFSHHPSRGTHDE